MTLLALGLLLAFSLHTLCPADATPNSTQYLYVAELNGEKDTRVRGTIYYDLNEATTGQICAARFGLDNWSNITENWEPTKCESARGTNYGLAQMNTSRILAIDWNLVNASMYSVCGKEVEVYLPNGEPFEMDDGPFVLWDACAKAMTDYVVDFSAKAVVGMWQKINGGDCMSGNPGGLTVKVTNRQAVGFELPSYGPSFTTTYTAGQVPNDAYTVTAPAPPESMTPWTGASGLATSVSSSSSISDTSSSSRAPSPLSPTGISDTLTPSGSSTPTGISDTLTPSDSSNPTDISDTLTPSGSSTPTDISDTLTPSGSSSSSPNPHSPSGASSISSTNVPVPLRSPKALNACPKKSQWQLFAF